MSRFRRGSSRYATSWSDAASSPPTRRLTTSCSTSTSQARALMLTRMGHCMHHTWPSCRSDHTRRLSSSRTRRHARRSYRSSSRRVASSSLHTTRTRAICIRCRPSWRTISHGQSWCAWIVLLVAPRWQWRAGLHRARAGSRSQ